jgi:hypothetical protein
MILLLSLVYEDGLQDKKAVERFVSEQLQQERVRYQTMLSTSVRPETRASDISDVDDVFRNCEVQEHLFKIHVKVEPHLKQDDDEEANNNNLSNSDGSTISSGNLDSIVILLSLNNIEHETKTHLK